MKFSQTTVGLALRHPLGRMILMASSPLGVVSSSGGGGGRGAPKDDSDAGTDADADAGTDALVANGLDITKRFAAAAAAAGDDEEMELIAEKFLVGRKLLRFAPDYLERYNEEVPEKLAALMVELDLVNALMVELDLGKKRCEKKVATIRAEIAKLEEDRAALSAQKLEGLVEECKRVFLALLETKVKAESNTDDQHAAKTTNASAAKASDDDEPKEDDDAQSIASALSGNVAEVRCNITHVTCTYFVCQCDFLPVARTIASTA